MTKVSKQYDYSIISGAAAIDVTPGRNLEDTERLDVDVTEYFTDNDFEINNLGFYYIFAINLQPIYFWKGLTYGRRIL